MWPKTVALITWQKKVSFCSLIEQILDIKTDPLCFLRSFLEVHFLSPGLKKSLLNSKYFLRHWTDAVRFKNTIITEITFCCSDTS